ncbi:MAG: LptA/OstA family protein [Rhodobacteraceae bacterium]|nr:LptA/OstA family protein [Paracoccaceae bacterium]
MRAIGLAALMLSGAAGWAVAQGASVPFGGLEHDSTLPVEITSDALALDQAAGTAVFTGTVKVGQGALRLAADRLEVFYAADDTGTGAIERMEASGNVTLSNGTEAAEAARASYVVATGIVEMEGDVLLTQGANALASEKLRIDLVAGTGLLEGRVQTIFMPGETGGAAGSQAGGGAPAGTTGGSE